MLKILCPGGYTWRNKGDAALIMSMLAELRRKFSEADFVVLSDTPDLDSEKYKEEVLPIPFEPNETSERLTLRLFDHLISWRFGNSRFHLSGLRRRRRRWLFVPLFPYREFALQLFQASILLRCFGERALFLFRRDFRETYRSFLNADLVIFVPGGYFLAPHRDHLHWLRHLFCLALAESLSKPIVFFAVSMGPFVGNLNRWLARHYLNKADLIVLREEQSKNNLKELGVTRPRIVVTTDVAFLLQDSKTDRVMDICVRHRHGAALAVGMALREYDFPTDPQSERKIAEYPITLAKAIDHLIDVHDASILLMPQVSAPECNDIAFSRRVMTHVHRIDRVHVVDEDLTPAELKWLYGQMDVFVGVRMHANIFALANGVPVVAIAYEPKTVGIMNTIGLSDYALDIRLLEYDSLNEKIDALIRSRETIISHLRSEQIRIRELARMSAEVIFDYVNSGIHN